MRGIAICWQPTHSEPTMRKPLPKAAAKATPRMTRRKATGSPAGSVRTTKPRTKRESVEAELAAWFKQFDERLDKLQARQNALQKSLEDHASRRG